MTEKKCMNECLRSLMPYPYACTKIYEKTQTFKHDQKLENNMVTKTILNQCTEMLFASVFPFDLLLP